MAQIRIDTEHTREVGRRFATEGDRLAEIGHELQRAIGSLDTWAWDGRSRWRAEPLLNRVRPESARVANGLDELGRKLVRVADTFEQEDNTAARNLEGMPWVDFSTTGPSGSLWGGYSGYLKDNLFGDTEDLLTAGFALRLLLGLRAGIVYPGEVILKDPFGMGLRALIKNAPGKIKEIIGTPRDIRKILGLHTHLNHIKWQHLSKHMTKGAFVTAVAIEAVKLPGQFLKDINEYRDKGASYVAGAMLVSTGGAALRVAGTTAGTYVGSTVGGAVGAAVGSVIPIVGTAIGGAVGSIVGGWVGGQVGSITADWVMSKVREPAIEATAEFIEDAAETVQEVGRGVVRAGEQVVEEARDAIGQVGKGVGKVVGSVISLFG